MAWILPGGAYPRSAFIRTRAAAASESTHAEHTAWARSGVVDEAATDEAGGAGEAAVAEPGGPPQAAMEASANRSIPRGRRLRSRQRMKATDSPPSPSAARRERAYCG